MNDLSSAMTLPRISELDDETVRVMMAVADGWVPIPKENFRKFPMVTWNVFVKNGKIGSLKTESLPGYPTSLDAVASVLATMTEMQWVQYREELEDLTYPYGDLEPGAPRGSLPRWGLYEHQRAYLFATARQHCDAFLIARGLAAL